jgi:DNA-binding GntR family transcriptional regulator
MYGDMVERIARRPGGFMLALSERYRLKPGEPASGQLVGILRSAIVRLDIKPGDWISEQELANAFGLSRHPIREALLQLRDTGLIRSMPQRGTQVLRISIDGVRSACFVREALECAAARQASTDPIPEPLKDAKYNIEQQRTAAKNNDIEHFFQLDDDFHRIITIAARCEIAWTIIEEHKAQIDRIRHIKLQRAKARDPLYRNLYAVNISEHEEILNAIVAQDTARAEALMRHHTTKILSALAILKADHGELFDAEPDAKAPFKGSR